MSPEPTLWHELRDAVRGVPRDYTKGHLPRAVLLLAIPMVLEMTMQSLFSVADIYFVGRLGSEAQAIVGLTDSLLALVFAVAVGLSMGAAAMVARRIGEKKSDEAGRAAVQAILVGLVFSVVSGVLFVWQAESLLQLLGGDAELASRGRSFAAIMLGGNVTVTLLFLINAIFRGAGEPVSAMWALALANGLNILFDPLLIFGIGPFPELGLEGAAIATTGARGLAVLYQLTRLMRGNGALQLTMASLRVVPSSMIRLVRVSLVGIVQFTISTTSFIGVFQILSGFGAQALAGYTIAVRVIIFVLLPVWGVGNAAATLVGQNLGAGKPDRAERAVWLAARWNAIALIPVTALLVLAGETVLQPFSTDAEALAVAARCLRIISLSYVFWGFGVVTVLAFNGAGDTTTPTYINLIAYWLVQLLLAWVLGVRLEFGPTGVFAAIAIAQATLALLGIVSFRRGRWKGRQI